MKRIISILLTITMAFCITGSIQLSASAATTDKVKGNSTYTDKYGSWGYEWTDSRDGYKITYYDKSISDIEIPDAIDNIPVLEIGDGAFKNCGSLASITIPDSVTTIADNAFWGCSSLTSITMSNSVTSIGDGAFSYCYNLTSITIPNSVTSIGNSAFDYCYNLTSIIIPDSVISIGDSAFSHCNRLAIITIPNSVTTIADNAFYFCYNLNSINVSSNNKKYSSIDGVLFDKSQSKLICYPAGKLSDNYTIPNSVTSISDSAFCCSSLTNITIPNSVTSIGDSAFYVCNNLTSITIPNSVTSIGDNAFESCDNLTSITISNSVTSIGDSAFYACSSLINIDISSNNKKYSSIDGVLFNKSQSKLIYYPAGKLSDNYTIPDSVTSIGDSAFRYCYNLTSITIPNSVTIIGDSAFYYCGSLTSITIPDSVTTIADSAFYACCSLTSITIPNSVTTIADNAFYFCEKLTNINVSSNNKKYSSTDGVLFDKSQSKLICYPAGKSSDNYTIPDSVTTIGDSVFYYCSSLTSITIPNSVTSIADNAFYICSSLTNINVSSNNKKYSSIDGVLFDKAQSKLICYPAGKLSDNYTISNSVTSIGNGAFYYCNNLTSITIPDSVTSIGNYAFATCGSLKDVYYTGSESQWSKISISSKNNYLQKATIHFNFIKQKISDLNNDDTISLIDILYFIFYKIFNL